MYLDEKKILLEEQAKLNKELQEVLERLKEKERRNEDNF